MGKKRVIQWLSSKLSRLRDGDRAADEAFLNTLMFWCHSELRWRAIVGSAKVGCWVVDIPNDFYLSPGFLSRLDSHLRWMNAIQTSLSDWLESGRPTLLYSLGQSCLNFKWEGLPEEPSEASIPSYAVVVSAVILLSLVYQYLTGNVDRGGSKAYSRSSLDFRDVYVAIVLFLGAYVWIKFREVAPKGFYSRTLVYKHGGSKKVYEARLKPPLWNGKKVPRLDLGRFATEQEARNKFLIAAFYYNLRSSKECLLDGWFPVPSMSDEEQSLVGLEKRKWVIDQAKKVYEDFKKRAEALAALERELFETCQGQATPGHDEVNVDLCGASLLNAAGHQQPTLASQVENLGMGMGMGMVGLGHGLECASHSFDGIHELALVCQAENSGMGMGMIGDLEYASLYFNGMLEGLVLPNGHNLGSQEGYALPDSQLPPNIESVCTLQQQISDQQQQILEFGVKILELQNQQGIQQQQISDQQHQIQEFGAKILQLQNQQGIQQEKHLQESWFQNPQWSYQFCLQEQQLEDVNQGVPSFQMEMEQSIHQGLTALPPAGGEVQEAFGEMDTLW